MKQASASQLENAVVPCRNIREQEESCKWIFKRNNSKGGTIDKNKIKLLVKGFGRIHSVDYVKKFSPVVKN